MIPDRLKARLDPTFAAWLEASNPPLPPGFQPTVEQLRAAFREQVAISNGPLAEGLAVEDTSIAGRDAHAVPLRIYRHRERSGPQPFCCFLHGGGWMLGDLDTHQGVCNDLALCTGMSIVAIDYRLSPEHPYPAALDDTVDALRALAANAAQHALDPTRMLVAADSAGASLALSATLSLRGTEGVPKAVALVYPALGADMERPSFVDNVDLPGLTPELMRFFFVSYIGGETLPDPLAAPLTVEDLSNLPPLFVSVAEHDPLRDDGTDLAARLRGAGQPVVLRVEPTLGHGYLWVRRRSPVAGEAFTALCAFLRDAAGLPSPEHA